LSIAGGYLGGTFSGAVSPAEYLQGISV